jgi:hypothetical protein
MFESVRIRPAHLLAAAGLAWAVSLAGAAWAHGDHHPVTLRGALRGSEADDGRGQQAPPVARYMAGDGDRFFLDRSGSVALLRFERADEVWALHPTPAPGGDVIYRNDLGQPVLRASRLGGLTLFTPHQPMGEAVAMLGEAPASKIPRASISALSQVLNVSTIRIGKAVNRNIVVHAVGGAGSEYIFADTLNITADTIVKMSQLRDGRPYLANMREVFVHPDKKTSVRYHNGVLDIAIAPKDGVAGRPSSGKIAWTIVNTH